MGSTISSALPGGPSPAKVATPPPGATAPQAGQKASSAVDQASASAAPTPQQDNQKVEQALESIKRVVAPVAQNLQFSIDSETNTTVIKVVDGNTQEVIRQIPSEEVLSLARNLDKLQGLLLKQEA